MSAAEILDLPISEPLTWAEICARYPDEWVSLVEMHFIHPNGMELLTARVIGHGRTRDAPLRRAQRWFSQYEDIGHFYTGTITHTPIRPVLVLDVETRDAFRYPR